ncbi:TPA: hypothetical protein ACH3X3_012106 [Trebouxia sp. C0006]
MVGMVDEANDMWAAATVLFQLLMSGYPEWESKFGLFMFGLTDAALVTANRLPDRGQKWQENMRGKIMTELWDLWVVTFYPLCSPIPLGPNLLKHSASQKQKQGWQHSLQQQQQQRSNSLSQQLSTKMTAAGWQRSIIAAAAPNYEDYGSLAAGVKGDFGGSGL